MLTAAKHLLRSAAPELERARARAPDYALALTGHSLGAAVATLATVLLLQDLPSLPLRLDADERAQLRCFAVAQPPCLTASAIPAGAQRHVLTFCNAR